MNSCRRSARGPGALQMMACLAVMTMLSGCANYVPGAKAYWDAKVKEMCEKDGGVKIFEKIYISKADIDLLGKVDGNIGIPNKKFANPRTPIYSEFSITDIKEKNPRVSRMESQIIRRVDGAVIARWVLYSRAGGDLPTGVSEGTSFSCPKPAAISLDLQQLFVLKGD